MPLRRCLRLVFPERIFGPHSRKLYNGADFAILTPMQLGKRFRCVLSIMKAVRIILYGVLLMFTLYVYVQNRALPDAALESDRVDIVMVQEAVFLSLADSPKVVEPVVQPMEVETIGVAVAEIKPQPPIQPIEERGDAMLFESEALFGTPFDRAIVIPFN